jgi:hypothetical protein
MGRDAKEPVALLPQLRELRVLVLEAGPQLGELALGTPTLDREPQASGQVHLVGAVLRHEVEDPRSRRGVVEPEHGRSTGEHNEQHITLKHPNLSNQLQT